MENITFNNNNEIFNNESNSNLQRNKICWNCSNLIQYNDNERVVMCPSCNKYNHISKINNKSRNINKTFISNLNSLENNRTIDNSEKIITCPFCYTKNLFNSDAEELICYNCRKNMNSGFINSFQFNSGDMETQLNKNIVGWRIVPSQQPFFSSPNPMTPPPQYESNTDYLLKKILKKLKKQKNIYEYNTIQQPNYIPFNVSKLIPFPVVDYYNSRRINYIDEYPERDNNVRLSEIRYLPIKTERENPKKDGYKITIRKKKRNEKGISKSTVFEKVFYLK